MSVVVLDYNDLLNEGADLNESIAKAFGNSDEALGVVFVKNVPGILEMRSKLLKSASKLAALPANELQELEHPESYYMFGWSWGKELFNGQADVAKGSFYNNPLYDIPPNATPELQKSDAPYYSPNLWPKSLPNLKEEFQSLAKVVIDVGQLVAMHCDKFLKVHYPDLPNQFLRRMIQDSVIHKSRLLHYFPMKPEDAAVSDEGNMDSWCGIHLDHSVLTGLISAMYIDESKEGFPEIDREDPKVQEALSTAGLYIKDRKQNYHHVNIPDDYIAFQIGEAAQIASGGLLMATPHLVSGAAYPNMARNTFATFMQPNLDHELKSGYTFAKFTLETLQSHY